MNEHERFYGKLTFIIPEGGNGHGRPSILPVQFQKIYKAFFNHLQLTESK